MALMTKSILRHTFQDYEQYKLSLKTEILDRRRAELLTTALEDCILWCGPPGKNIKNIKSKYTDQTWADAFLNHAEKLDGSFVHRFLVNYQLANRVRWNKEKAASVIDWAISEDLDDLDEFIADLASRLQDCIESKNKGQQTSAASKIVFLLKPLEPTFIWDQLVMRSVRLRSWRGCRKSKKKLHSKFVQGKQHNYASFRTCCVQILKDELSKTDFREAAKAAEREIRKVKSGPMVNSSLFKADFFERRLLDKLMFWEGHQIRCTEA